MELTVDLSKAQCPSPHDDYKELCRIDAKINSLLNDQREAMPAVIHLIDDELVWPKRLHRQLRRRIGLDDVSGPFYEDHYLDNGVRKVFSSCSKATNDYQNLVSLDASVRKIENEMKGWSPERRRKRNEHLKYVFARKNTLKNKLGLKGVSGPFYADHYMDGGKRKVYEGAA
ncbi:hypothetical protein pEaSNUABM40_00209 [Erwinia phage pEa_SNUABM_40]|nr:hypothetical protein pEaSNUABM20_00206 [Erwinia phage pEa_SNUABM_20]QZE58425.1 hypothetical protein pEaSNUABM40_00209 [Erwinia phage pEa_SNUABM_40]UAW52987.1 hypothetical protein pEaSNUABM23_00205 [Erwinia phage pEa_SNUABM_23]UIW10883.1 hypothetical protein pEaSNUABM23_00205 [Erwinia phage pEa_SNUABM_31]